MNKKSTQALSFARSLLAEMSQQDPRASTLEARTTARSPDAQIGFFEDGEFVRLLRLGAASPAYNVMSLFVWQQDHWIPTFERSTPEKLAHRLVGPYQHLWLFDVLVRAFPSDQAPPNDQ